MSVRTSHRGCPLGIAGANLIRFFPRRISKPLSKCGVSGKAFNVIPERRNRANELMPWRVLKHAASDYEVEEHFGVVVFWKAFGSRAWLRSLTHSVHLELTNVKFGL